MSIDTAKNDTDAIFVEGIRFLQELLRIPSLSGRENDAMAYLYDQFSKLDVMVEKVPLSDHIKCDPDYSSPIADLTYEGRYNVKVTKKGKNSGRKIVFNAHVDVVPPSEGMDDPYSGTIKDGLIYGRGACDNKGPLTAVYMLLALLEKQGIEPECDIVVHLVVEEENGGNGSLAMVRNCETADACIVLEPTELQVLSAIRGAVWFKIEFFGKAGHSGQAGQTRSAILMAHEAITLLQQYHKDLLNSSKHIALFDQYENPMPITFGKLQSGNWPASAPNYAVLEGVLGFLPNKNRDQICSEIESVLNSGKLIQPDNFKLSFTYRHNSSVIDPKHPFVEKILAAANKNGIQSQVGAMPASCDAWLYNNVLGISTVVFGPGSLKVAHSKDEFIETSDILKAATVLFELVSAQDEFKCQ